MPTLIAGNILSKSQDGKRVKLDDGNWYGAFAAASLNHVGMGDHVTFSYDLSAKTDQNGNPYRNIKSSVNKAGATGSASVSTTGYVSPPVSNQQIKVGEPILSNSRCIIRQNALTNAVNLMKSFLDRPDSSLTIGDYAIYNNAIIYNAKQFEAYTSGDDDEAEAKKELGE